MGRPTSDLEASIVAIAVEHGYVEHAFGDARTLYLPTTRRSE